jgi:hypothetical protein
MRTVLLTGMRLGAAGTNRFEEEAVMLAVASGDFRKRYVVDR